MAQTLQGLVAGSTGAVFFARPSTHIILIFGRDVVGNLMDHSFRLPIEFSPNATCRCSPCYIGRNPNEAEPSIELLWVRLGPPPIRSGGLDLCDGIVKAN